MIKKRYHDVILYRRLLRQTRPYWWQIGIILLLSLLATPFVLLTPLPLKIAVDNVVGQEPVSGFLGTLLPTAVTESETALLTFAVSLLLLIALVDKLRDLVVTVLRTYTSEKLVLSFRSQIFRHIQRLSLAYHDSKGTSDSTYCIQYDAPSIYEFLINGVIPSITSSVTVIAMVYITARIDWQLALVALAVSPFLFLVARSYQGHLRRQWRQAKAIESETLSVVQEVLTALRVVKAFGQEDREQERFIQYSGAGMQARIRLSLVEGKLGVLLKLTTTVGTAAVLFIGISHIQANRLTLGDLLLIMGYLSQLYSPLNTIGKKIGKLQGHLASAERAYRILDRTPEVRETPHALRLKRTKGSVTFRNVSFAYAPPQRVLSDISFAVPKGTRVGIIGKTGSGKTTLLSLLTRFYDPTAGQILLDNVDLRQYKLADLRNQFAIVLQESVLFSTSIAENIAYAYPEASNEQVIEAAKAANAHEFITSFPCGYQTQVAERGIRLSGGERQRIALARAFLKDSPILILDEPTSSVDVQTEVQIMEAMERLMRGRTTFMISHRLSTLENCDVLLVIENGQLIETTSDVSAAIENRFAAG